MKYVSIFKDNRGKLRARFRRKGYSCYLPLPIGSDAFEKAYAEAILHRGTPIAQIDADTFEALIQEYYASLDFRTLSDSTKAIYMRNIDQIRRDHGHRLVKDMERKHMRTIMDALPPKKADWTLRFFRLLLNFGVERGYRNDNPVLRMKHYGQSDGHLPWPETLIEKYQAHWPRKTMQRLLFDLALYTGLRRSDLAQVSWNQIDGDLIRVMQQKTKHAIWIPVHPELALSIKAVPRRGLYLIGTQSGNMRSSKALGGYFRKACKAANIPNGFSLHGLRKSCATRLADAGCSAHQIAAITGHLTLSEVEHYTRAADQKRLAREAIERIK